MRWMERSRHASHLASRSYSGGISRSGRSGADPRSGRGCGGVGADPPSCEVREGGAGVDLASKHTPVQRQHLGVGA